MQIAEENNKSKGRVYLKNENQELAAEMTYSQAGPELIIVDHTDVQEAYRGQGLGRQLLDFLVEKARKESFKIMPLCPFAKSVFNKDPSIRDVLK